MKKNNNNAPVEEYDPTELVFYAGRGSSRRSKGRYNNKEEKSTQEIMNGMRGWGYSIEEHCEVKDYDLPKLTAERADDLIPLAQKTNWKSGW